MTSSDLKNDAWEFTGKIGGQQVNVTATKKLPSDNKTSARKAGKESNAAGIISPFLPGFLTFLVILATIGFVYFFKAWETTPIGKIPQNSAALGLKGYVVMVQMSKSLDQALFVANNLRKKRINAKLNTYKNFYIVYIGPFISETHAIRILKAVRTIGFHHAALLSP